jgi:hypothetical protein
MTNRQKATAAAVIGVRAPQAARSAADLPELHVAWCAAIGMAWTKRPDAYGWITALRAPAIKKLMADGPLQLSLFD